MIGLPFPRGKRNTNLLVIVHPDVFVLNDFLIVGGNKYFITFIDDCSRFVHIYLMKSNNEYFTMFKSYKLFVKNQLDKKIRVLRNDKGDEYFPSKFSITNEQNRIIHQISAPYLLQQNGLIKRKLNFGRYG